MSPLSGLAHRIEQEALVLANSPLIPQYREVYLELVTEARESKQLIRQTIDAIDEERREQMVNVFNRVLGNLANAHRALKVLEASCN